MATAFSERLDLELCSINSIYSINSFHAFHATRIDIPGRTNERTKGNTWGQRKKKGRGKNAMVKPNHVQITIEKNKREREKKKERTRNVKKKSMNRELGISRCDQATRKIINTFIVVLFVRTHFSLYHYRSVIHRFIDSFHYYTRLVDR